MVVADVTGFAAMTLLSHVVVARNINKPCMHSPKDPEDSVDFKCAAQNAVGDVVFGHGFMIFFSPEWSGQVVVYF